MTKVGVIQREANRYLKMWRERPLTIILYSCPDHFDVGIVQYQLQSMDALREKLKQFQPGTRFTLPDRTDNRLVEQRCIAELRDFLTAHKMHLAEEKE